VRAAAVARTWRYRAGRLVHLDGRARVAVAAARQRLQPGHRQRAGGAVVVSLLPARQRGFGAQPGLCDGRAGASGRLSPAGAALRSDRFGGGGRQRRLRRQPAGLSQFRRALPAARRAVHAHHRGSAATGLGSAGADRAGDPQPDRLADQPDCRRRSGATSAQTGADRATGQRGTPCRAAERRAGARSGTAPRRRAAATACLRRPGATGRRAHRRTRPGG